MNAPRSYKAVVSEISRHHKVSHHFLDKRRHSIQVRRGQCGQEKGVRDLRADCQGDMKHMIALKIRVTSHPVTPAVNLGSIDMVLPLSNDVSQLKGNILVLVSRVLCQYIQCFSTFGGAIASHIPHTHSKQ